MKQSLINEIRRCRPLLGAWVEIAVTHENIKQAQLAINEAFAIIERVHALMSFHDPQSEVTRLNCFAGRQPVLVSPETYRVLEFSQRLHKLSGGIFDVTVAPELLKQKLLPKHGFLKHIGNYLGKTGDIKLVFPRTVYFVRPLCLDLGGVAKGFAVDKAVEVLRRHGIKNAIVNAGGDMRCFGNRVQPVWLRHPESPQKLLPLWALKDAALATSANSYGYAGFTDKTCAHIHGQTRQPLRCSFSVSVRADSCMVADALTKIVFALKERSAMLLERFNATALMAYPDGTMLPCDA